MRWVGAVDNLFSAALRAVGVFDPHIQLYILLIVIVFYVILALRAVGGLLGWAMLFFAVLILLHRLEPGIASGTQWPVITQLEQGF